MAIRSIKDGSKRPMRQQKRPSECAHPNFGNARGSESYGVLSFKRGLRMKGIRV